MRKLVLLFVLALPACQTISDKALQEIHDTALVSDNLLRRWDTLTDDQKKSAFFRVTRTCFDVDFSVAGRPIPPAYVASGS